MRREEVRERLQRCYVSRYFFFYVSLHAYLHSLDCSWEGLFYHPSGCWILKKMVSSCFSRWTDIIWKEKEEWERREEDGGSRVGELSGRLLRSFILYSLAGKLSQFFSEDTISQVKERKKETFCYLASPDLSSSHLHLLVLYLSLSLSSSFDFQSTLQKFVFLVFFLWVRRMNFSLVFFLFTFLSKRRAGGWRGCSSFFFSMHAFLSSFFCVPTGERIDNLDT